MDSLDTAWCPVCDKRISTPEPRKLFPTPAPPAPAVPQHSSSSTAIKQSQTTRGKHGTIKARTGGGLLHGTGRIRPGGGLKRDATLTAKQRAANAGSSRTATPAAQLSQSNSQQQLRSQQQQQQQEPPNPAPLYCSEECRLADMMQSEMFFNPQPTSKSKSSKLHPFLHAHAWSDETISHKFAPSHPHPSLINPASRSPPPPSPTLPPAPPNSWSAHSTATTTPAVANALALAAAKANRFGTGNLSDAEAEQSDSSSGESASYEKDSSAVHFNRGSGNARLNNASRPPLMHSKTSSSPKKSSVPSRTQSALELYSRYPLLLSSARSRSSRNMTSNQSNPSLYSLPTTSTSYSHSYMHSHHNPDDQDITVSSPTSTLGPSQHPGSSTSSRQNSYDELLVGRRFRDPNAKRPLVPPGVENLLCLPAAMTTRPTSLSKSLSSSSISGMASQQALPNLVRRSSSSSSASSSASMMDLTLRGSALGSVEEEGKVPSALEHEYQKRKIESKERKEKRRLERLRKEQEAAAAAIQASTRVIGANMEAPNWNYDDVAGPKYLVPVPPINREFRLERVFLADDDKEHAEHLEKLPAEVLVTAKVLVEPAPRDPETGEAAFFPPGTVFTRRVLREVQRSPGTMAGKPGHFVQVEIETTFIPERKRLFLFGGSR